MNATPSPHVMQCMEVWGGNSAAERTVEMPGLRARVHSRPYRGADRGGDVYYLSSCATGRITRMLLADVSGHGDRVAAVAEQLRFLMRKFVNFLDQSRFVERLNEEFGGRARDGTFATAVAATFWAPTQYLVACNAGHPLPVRYSNATREWSVLQPSETRSDGPADLPLGVLGDVRYGQVGARLEAGDLLLLYTDGLVEAASPDGSQFGLEGVLETLRSLDAGRPDGVLEGLVDRLGRFRDGAPGNDDLTLVLLEATGEHAPPPSLERAVASLTLFFRLLGGRLRGRRTPVPWPELSVPNILGPFVPWANRAWGGDRRRAGVQRR